MSGRSLHGTAMKAEASKAARAAGCLRIGNGRDMRSADARSKHPAQEHVCTIIIMANVRAQIHGKTNQAGDECRLQAGGCVFMGVKEPEIDG